MSNVLKNYPLKIGQANFLIGLAGNGFSSALQNELYSGEVENIFYTNFININDNSEKGIVLELINNLLQAIGIPKLADAEVDHFHSAFEVFTFGIERLKRANVSNKKIWLVFDEFHQTKSYSNSFFFTLDKLVSIPMIIPGLSLTTIFVLDEYTSPAAGTTSQGLRKLFYHYPNFHVIRALKTSELNDAVISLLDQIEDVPKEIISKIMLWSSGNPALANAIAKMLIDKPDSNIDELLNSYELEWKLHESWESLGEVNQEIIRKIHFNHDFVLQDRLQTDFLRLTGLVDIQRKVIPSPLFAVYTAKQLQVSAVSDPDYIIIGQKVIYLPDLPKQIESILKLLHERKDKLVTREEIGQAIWGESYIDKYSDYAIDKLISQLRQKVQLESGAKLLTKRGRGYILRW